MSIGAILILAVSALLLIYLTFALLKPEKFWCQKPDRQGGQLSQRALPDGRASDTVRFMTLNGWLQILFYFVLILAVTKPLGVSMANVFERRKTFLDR